MLDSWQTAQVGYMDYTNGYMHEGCGVGPLVWLRAERLMAVDPYQPWYRAVDKAIEQLDERLGLGEGFTAVSRYDLGSELEHEWGMAVEYANDLSMEDLIDHLGVGAGEVFEAVQFVEDGDVQDIRERLMEEYLTVQVTCYECGLEIS